MSWSNHQPPVISKNSNGVDGEKEADRRIIHLPYLPTIDDLHFPRSMEKAKTLWVLSVILEVLLTCILILRLANFVNTTFIHTYDLPVDSPGSLLSTRRSIYYWFNVVTFSLQIAVCVIGSARVACPWSTFSSLSHSILASISTLAEIGLLILMIVYSGTCNSRADPLNPCNDKLYYCTAYSAPNDFANTPTGCPTPTAPSSIVVLPASLGWDVVFAYHFGFTIASAVGSLVFAGVGIYISTELSVMFGGVEFSNDVYTVRGHGEENSRMENDQNMRRRGNVNYDTLPTNPPSQKLMPPVHNSATLYIPKAQHHAADGKHSTAGNLSSTFTW